ncbi:hypothetical protein [Parapedobacter koreensis]|uniref:Uncharacterized conserved protein, contains GH25 family domain n=1 Tax=Parapedobacter koreensis TaxID=332977 RepID=A0A1H7JY48_9SPHI|nr:hypothetical protein [Parapedobacter koreensis]SEK78545.1 Uncharacterized conserved protein, contains GH25 family domain [Parapedobacter koreensis]
MKYLKILFLFIALISATFHASAHALWIETTPIGKAGQVHTVKLFFGEYAEGEREPLTNWHSDLKDLELWLTKPDGSKEKLTVNPDSNFLHTSFVPSANGVYILSTAHKLGDLNGDTQLEFLAQTTVSVGKIGDNPETMLSSQELTVFPQSPAKWKVNKPTKLKALHKGGTLTEGFATILSPTGWTKGIPLGADGTVDFIPLWPGTYVIEISHYEKTPGKHKANSYEALWQGATYSIEVAK